MALSNHDLKEDIRDYWSRRSATFDLAFGHRIPPGPEMDAWAAAVRAAIGAEPKRVLELACGTGEVTNVLLSLGHDVTALDFSEAMLSVARAKHAGNPRARFLLADAEETMEPDAAYDAVICRHLVWTLTRPEQAFADWFRVLRPGGRLLIFDGNWASHAPLGRAANLAIRLLETVIGPDPHYDGAMSEAHSAIMQRLPFGSGLTPESIEPLLGAAGFRFASIHSGAAIRAAQRKKADLRNRLRTFLYRRFILTAIRPDDRDERKGSERAVRQDP
ncbi:class I SAM-dependent methyltransferase [Rhizobium sp. SSA_523]|uniref:class I SAM-dependent methyltransferase n=1 Tax=Rhizobium sp. SSA_523 TaxID=2952477 RepID=UPI002091723C|nr:class I SAM-dependent methyltransferase [Rhizobium sp. SSA_523]MCO5731207.1 class I SAM-dependent methyltransferase [Rhizobium sp. SSA_523]WKC22251.1 class I SAM-dependent methyltransferase [Rhizobium sp. SSA_523]